MKGDGNKGTFMESPFMRFLEIVFYLWVLNVITLILCLPIVTMGAALTAMNHQLYLIAKNEEGYVVKGYFKDFASNFKRSTPAGLLMAVVGGVLGYDFYIFATRPGQFNTWFRCGIVAVAVLYLFVLVYLFPILARYDCTLKMAFKNSLFMAIYKLFYSIPMVTLMLMPWILTAIVTNFFFWDILFGLSLPAFLNVFMYRRIFEAFEKNQRTHENGGVDPEEVVEEADNASEEIVDKGFSREDLKKIIDKSEKNEEK